jgi:ATP-dependent RNA helicase DDX19/DBP5
MLTENILTETPITATGINCLAALKATTSGGAEKKFPKGHKFTEHIIVGTAGKVEALSKRAKGHFDMSKIQMFVMDEADDLLAKGSNNKKLCDDMAKGLPESCQKVLFSATYRSETVETAKKFVGANSEFILLPEVIVDKISQLFIRTDDKMYMLKQLYDTMTIGQTVIFCATKNACDQVHRDLGYDCSFLHSNLSPEERLAALNKFRAGDTKVLVTTDVLARGKKSAAPVHAAAAATVVCHSHPTDDMANVSIWPQVLMSLQ